jgi:hypothetical protein
MDGPRTQAAIEWAKEHYGAGSSSRGCSLEREMRFGSQSLVMSESVDYA